MMRALFIAGFLGAICVPPQMAGAQSMNEEAQAAVQAVGSLSGIFTQETIENTLDTFETANPKETGYNSASFEAELNALRLNGSADADALKSVEDSRKLRPDVTLDPEGNLFGAANDAHTNKGTIAGDIFSAEQGSCTTSGGAAGKTTEKFCERRRVNEQLSCQIKRQISFDRFDTYSCTRSVASTPKTCRKVIRFACKTTNHDACVARNTSVSSAGHNQIRMRYTDRVRGLRFTGAFWKYGWYRWRQQWKHKCTHHYTVSEFSSADPNAPARWQDTTRSAGACSHTRADYSVTARSCCDAFSKTEEVICD